MPNSKKTRNWRKIVRRTSVEWLAEGYAFFLPAHKADTAFEGNKVIIPTDEDPTFNPLPISADISHDMMHNTLYIQPYGSQHRVSTDTHLVHEEAPTTLP